MRWRRTRRTFAPIPVLLDAIYDPWPTPLAAAVDAAGGRVISGLQMLLNQAYAQVERSRGCLRPGSDAGRAGRPLADRTAPMLAAVTSTMARYPVTARC